MIDVTMAKNKLAAKHTAPGFSGLLTKGYQPESYEYFITGYYYILWTKVPSFIDGQLGAQNAFKHLARVSNNAVTIPDITLNTVEVLSGFGGTNKIPVPTNLETQNEMSVKYYEYSGTPLTKAHQAWISAIRDYASGVSIIQNYSWINYTGEMLYITTKPVKFTDTERPTPDLIETAHLFTGVIPQPDKQSSFNSDLGTSDKVEQEISYKFAQMFMGKDVHEYAATKLSEMIKLADMSDYSIQDGGPKRKTTGSTNQA